MTKQKFQTKAKGPMQNIKSKLNKQLATDLNSKKMSPTSKQRESKLITQDLDIGNLIGSILAGIPAAINNKSAESSPNPLSKKKT